MRFHLCQQEGRPSSEPIVIAIISCRRSLAYDLHYVKAFCEIADFLAAPHSPITHALAQGGDECPRAFGTLLLHSMHDLKLLLRGELQLDSKPFHLNQLCLDAENLFKDVVRKHQVDFSASCEEEEGEGADQVVCVDQRK